MRYVIAVSGLIPHGASLVPRDDSSQVPRLFLSAFLFLVLWIQTQAAGSHINQRLSSCLPSVSMGREPEVVPRLGVWDY